MANRYIPPMLRAMPKASIALLAENARTEPLNQCRFQRRRSGECFVITQTNYAMIGRRAGYVGAGSESRFRAVGSGLRSSGIRLPTENTKTIDRCHGKYCRF